MEREMVEDCPYCGGHGEMFGHAPGCDNDYCALAGGMDDCDGEVQYCGCAVGQSMLTAALQEQGTKDGE